LEISFLNSKSIPPCTWKKASVHPAQAPFFWSLPLTIARLEPECSLEDEERKELREPGLIEHLGDEERGTGQGDEVLCPNCIDDDKEEGELGNSNKLSSMLSVYIEIKYNNNNINK